MTYAHRYFVVVIAAILLASIASGCSGRGGGSPTGPDDTTPGNHNPSVNVNTDKTHLAYSEDE